MYYKHIIDYEFGKAHFITQSSDPKAVMREFYECANQCFGIRKSIGETNIIASHAFETDSLTVLLHNGDSIIFDEQHEKIKDEWEDED